VGVLGLSISPGGNKPCRGDQWQTMGSVLRDLDLEHGAPPLCIRDLGQPWRPSWLVFQIDTPAVLLAALLTDIETLIPQPNASLSSLS
jgi:hypothetical protein